jgi:hypothetical protein
MLFAVVRWNNVVHAAIGLNGTWVEGRAVAHCGQKMKLYRGSKNKVTKQPVTCVLCVAKEIACEQTEPNQQQGPA